MSQENVEVVRRWHDAMRSIHPGGIADVVAELWDADADYYPVRKWPEARPCHGQEAVAEFFFRGREALTRMDSEVRWLIALDDCRVLACGELRWEGRGSGISLEGTIYFSYWLRHGRLLRVEDHLTLGGALRGLGLEGETLEAVGLSERDAHAGL